MWTVARHGLSVLRSSWMDAVKSSRTRARIQLHERTAALLFASSKPHFDFQLSGTRVTPCPPYLYHFAHQVLLLGHRGICSLAAGSHTAPYSGSDDNVVPDKVPGASFEYDCIAKSLRRSHREGQSRQAPKELPNISQPSLWTCFCWKVATMIKRGQMG